MTTYLTVTPSQVAIARLAVDLAEELGEPVEESVRAIALAGEANVTIGRSIPTRGVVAASQTERAINGVDDPRTHGDAVTHIVSEITELPDAQVVDLLEALQRSVARHRPDVGPSPHITRQSS